MILHDIFKSPYAFIQAVRQRSFTELVSSKESQNKSQDQHGHVENAVTGQWPAPRGGAETVSAVIETDPALLLQTMSMPQIFMGKPETTIGKGVAVRGQLKFVRVLRVDGKFTGTLSSAGSVIIGTSGTLVSNISGLSSILVEGKLVGHVICDNVIIRSTGSVFGNVTCKSFFAENGSILIGTANIHPKAPLHVDADMNVVPGDGEFSVEMVRLDPNSHLFMHLL
jgi:cytoskeletal protein CcmA (bactofilin family)